MTRYTEPLICPCVHHGLRTGFGVVAGVIFGLLLLIGVLAVTP